MKPGRFLYFLFFLAAASCSKEMSFENITDTNNGTASYIFTGFPGECPGAILNGNYEAGTSLTSSNTVEINVNVLSEGTYFIQTDTLNGISFRASGTFVGTGAKTIIFKGTGTPDFEGSFTYTPGSNGCSFVIEVDGE